MKSKPFRELFAIPLRNGLTKPKATRGAGTKMVNMGELFANPRIAEIAMDRVPLNQAERNLSLLAAGDLLFARQSLVLSGAGKCSIFVSDKEEVCFESHVIRCRLNRDLAEPDFYFYFFSSPTGRKLIETIVEQGAGASGIRGSDLAELTVPWVDPKIQVRIATVFRHLDNKIAINHRINQTLEAMVQALFTSWFVDFDPVRAKIAAKAEGQDPLRAAMRAISGKPDDELDALPPEQYEQLAATAVLFPDEMDESAVVDIPKGWAVQSADSLTEVGIGKTPPRKEPQWFTEGQGEWRWVSIRDMGASGVFQQRTSEYLTSEAVVRFNVRVVPDRTVLLSFKLTIGRVAITDGPMVTNEAIAHFKLSSEAAVSSEYLYLYLKGFDFSTLGSTSSIADAVNSKTIRKMPITVASRDLIDRFTKSVAPLFEEMRNRQNEISSLGATRDALLPKLLSGEIEVPA
jgi:type I restriction enzyme S subunit